VSEEKQDFLRRWSRLKHEAASSKKELPVQNQKPVELPPLESLNFESDFKAFMHSKVEESIKRAALKKLFADPRFNVMDGLDTYIDDYTKAEPFSEGLFERIEAVREKLLAPPPEPASEEEVAAAVEQPKPPAQLPHEAQQDVDPGQDPKAV
jgi:hypothetical protein